MPDTSPTPTTGDLPSHNRTRQILRGPRPDYHRPESFGFELGASAVQPKASPPADAGETTKLIKPPKLDPETQRQFHRRLRLCCLVAAGPLLFFFVTSLTNFIGLFGRDAIGVPGTILCGAVLALMLGIAGWMFLVPPRPERVLRLLEIVVFGSLGLFFAYWQFNVQTALPEDFYGAVDRREAIPDMPVRPELPLFEGPEDPDAAVDKPKLVEPPRPSSNRTEKVRDIVDVHLSVRVLAAALIVHLNWLFLIVFHAVLVPNTLTRGIGATLALALLPLAIDGVVVASHDPTQANAIELFAVAVTLLGAASGLAIFGTAKQVELQRQVESAREAVREMGQYRLRRKLGAGGMGEVYLAEHTMLKRPCALKRIHAKYLDNRDQLQRFEREVQATAQLRHPNTVEIYDYGVADDGTFYYVMEYIPGLSLEELVGRFGPMPPERVIHLLRQVCGALREAHEAGLIHRDIKPSNIVVFRASSPHDRVKLVDFGLVHSLAEAEAPDRKITRDGLIVGTPEYMSPEQASGGVLDGRSDLFSVGSVAYFLLTAREAFHRDNAMKTLLAVVSETPPPIVELNPFVPDDLLGLVATCLAKDPAKRYRSAAELDLALEACSVASAWTEERAVEWWERNPETITGTGTDLASLPLRESQIG